MASATGPGEHLISLKKEGRSPVGAGALSLARASNPQTEEENAHERYIGLDAHASSCTLAVVGPSGKRLGSHVVETNPRALIPTTDGPALVALMKMGEDEWDAYARGSAVRRAGYSGLRRNVAIALGNWLAGCDAPDPNAVGELVAALSDEDPVVAESAAWGLGRLDPPRP